MRLDHGGLLVSDVERAVRFYTDALGLEEVPRPSTFDTPGAWLQGGGHHHIHLLADTHEAELAIGYGNHLALVVDDLDATVERVRAAGVEPGGEIIARGDGVRRTFVTDPDRNMIELMEFGVAVTGSEPRLTAPRRSG